MPTHRRKAAGEDVRCPQCGSTGHFAIYETTIEVHHLAQIGQGRWQYTGATLRRLQTRVPGLLVCASCAHPLGPPPDAALQVLPRRP